MPLTTPLRDRFGVTLRLELYTPQELSKIVTRSASILNVAIDPTGALEIARRSRGTPRIANRLLKRVRDFAHDNNIQRKILHRRIEDFLYRFGEAVDFVNKQNVILAKIRQYRDAALRGDFEAGSEINWYEITAAAG